MIIPPMVRSRPSYLSPCGLFATVGGKLFAAVPPHRRHGLRDFGQGFQSMAPAIDALETAILAGKLAHGGHKVLAWNAANAKAENDPAGNRKITKRKSTGRVDGMVALAMAVGLHAKEPPPPSYEFMGIVLNA